MHHRLQRQLIPRNGSLDTTRNMKRVVGVGMLLAHGCISQSESLYIPCGVSSSPPGAGDFVASRLQNAHPVELLVGVVYVPTWVWRPCTHGTMAESKQAFHLHG